MNDGTVAQRVVLFSRFLKGRGFKAFSSGVMDALRGLDEVGLSSRGDFRAVLRANLATNDMEWRLFDGLFDAFWRRSDDRDTDRGSKEAPGQAPENPDDLWEQVAGERPCPGGGPDTPVERAVLEGTAYSPVPNFEQQDLARFEKGDVQVAQLILKNMLSLFRVTSLRRARSSRRAGDLDFRRIMREGLKTGGTPLKLFYRRRRRRLRRLVLLADVSGSMDRYARFVIPFILGLRGLGPKAAVFVFSTSLTPVTRAVQKYPIDKALDVISREVPDWSGGTRIGHSLRQFNLAWGERLVNRRTVVAIMSDGWDLGAREVLRREMEVLKRGSHCILWLNPLAEDLDRVPMSRGMEAALPYVDYFLPVNSLRGLKRVARILSRVMVAR
ncbi:MAG: VWA domain-containing protein [Deltaproteobacteria bacterium]|nr:VWA domain-containing protein [Deltaproteobacteria bacterium]